MAIELIREIKKYTGVSGDSKPATAPAGSKFHETDTSDTYIFVLDSSTWVLYKNLGGELWL